MSKRIPLQHGLFTLIDDEDFERCSQFRWYADGRRYVMRDLRKSDGSRTTQGLGRFILNAQKEVQVDHINGNKLDNRKANLRFCTHQQNQCNKGKLKRNTSGFKGVSWCKKPSKWTAHIQVNGHELNLGYFVDIQDAAAAYAVAAKKYHGEFART